MGRKANQPEAPGSVPDEFALESEGGSMWAARKQPSAQGRQARQKSGLDPVTELLAGQYEPEMLDEVRRFRCGQRRGRARRAAVGGACC